MNKNHFHTIDALRFFAFLLVFLQHIPAFGITWYTSFNKWGANGVNFFFILSGFLISFFLIQEKIHTNSVDLKKFFIRRVLRIWPIYYVLLIVFFILPFDIINKLGLYNQFGYKHEWLYSFTFSENYKIISENKLSSLTPLSMNWSLCIEEHFYLLFPFIITYASLKRIPVVLIALFSTSILVKTAAFLFFHSTDFSGTELISCTDLFSMGALLGYRTATKNLQTSSFTLSIPNVYKWVFILLVIPLTFILQPLLPKNNIFYLLYPTIQGICFTLLIALFIPQKSTLQIPTQNILSYFGKISYGMYLYHITIINILYLIFLMTGFHINNLISLLILIAASLALTIVISHFSYVVIEKPILKVKEKYFP
ncbi:MAG: acyltransferase [Bacteroidetes bacterium]|nr:acyltransferase [Bacteroidota bacterium]